MSSLGLDICASLPDAIVVTDACSRVQWANEGFAQLVARDASQIVGTAFEDYVAETDPLALVGLAGLLAERRSIAEVTVVLGRGELETIAVALSAARSNDPEATFVLCARALGQMQEELAESTRWAASERDRADELASARDALAVLNSELRDSQAKIARMARLTGIAEMASSVLHNVGNVINSVGVGAELVRKHVGRAVVDKIAKATLALEAEMKAGEGISPRGDKLFAYLRQATAQVQATLCDADNELGELIQRIVHVKAVVSAQQQHAKTSGMVQTEDVNDVVREALKLHEVAFEKSSIAFEASLEPLEPFPIDRHKIVQILVNLLSNARHAIVDHEDCVERRIVVRTRAVGTNEIVIEVADSGSGITPQNLTKIFTHGFTTKKDGHGFGLHSCATSALELGGSLTAHSEGAGTGATFTLRLPRQPGAKLTVAA